MADEKKSTVVTKPTIIEKPEKQKEFVKPLIGFRNKTQFGVHIVLKNDELFLGPNQQTAKKYLTENVVSVHKLKLQEALTKGIIAIMR